MQDYQRIALVLTFHDLTISRLRDGLRAAACRGRRPRHPGKRLPEGRPQMLAERMLVGGLSSPSESTETTAKYHVPDASPWTV